MAHRLGIIASIAMEPPATETQTTISLLARGGGWRVSEIVCRAGPKDRPFEESHDWVSIAAVIEGTFTYRSTHGRALMTPGSVLLGNPGSTFQCSHEHGCGDRCIAFHFAPILMEEMAGAVRGVTRTAFPRHRIPPVEGLAPLHAAAWRILASSDPAESEELALDAALGVVALAQEGAEQSVSLADERRASKAVALIGADFASDLSLGALAEAAGLSRFHFLRVFRQAVGVTPYRYLLGRRLEAAMRRLRGGSESVLDIALACGFGDLSEFTRRFKARYGLPPNAFRKAARRS